MHATRLWDLPTRIIHWAFIPLLAMLWLSSEVLKSFELHSYLGLLMIGLVTFRLSWGFVGTKYAKFSQFLTGKYAVQEYLNGKWQGLGHNPLGGWSVLVLISLLLLLLLTGLFAHYHEDFYAPFASLVSHDVSKLANSVHKLLFNVLLFVVAIHVAAIVFYKRILKKDLITPMLTGSVDTDQPDQGRDNVKGWAVLFSTVNALIAIYIASGIWL